MALIFEPGTVLKTIQGNDIHIDSLHTECGRGVIYQVTVNGQRKAFKWCTSSPLDNDFYSFWIRTKEKAERGAPCESILWPEDITELSNDGFGYVMRLIPEGFHDLYDFMSGKVGFPSFRSMIDIAINLVHAFQMLHCEGYSYYVHHGTFFFNPNNGMVILSDPDYITVDGMHFRVLGIAPYMAPEIIMKTDNNRMANDRYMLSVYLFMLFCLNHPLEGKRYLVPVLAPAHQEKLYGSEPLFIMDPDDNSNGPHPLIHRNTIAMWRNLPVHMRQMFCQAFSQQALHHPASRPRERNWLSTLIRLRSEAVRCSCGNELFYEAGHPCQCEDCHQILRFPLQLEFGEYCIPANKGTKLFRCQFGACDPFDVLKPIAYIVEKKDAPGVLGIRNMTDQGWDASTTKGVARKVAPGGVVPLKSGITIHLLGTQLIITEENQLSQSE